MSMEKKTKAKSKTKTSEGRKQLTSVRVVQRNLVYIMGLPLDLADEEVCTSCFCVSIPTHCTLSSHLPCTISYLNLVPSCLAFTRERLLCSVREGVEGLYVSYISRDYSTIRK